MGSTLKYGHREVHLSAEQDIPDLLTKIRKAVNSGMAKWIEVRTAMGIEHILVTGGVPISVATRGSVPGNG